LGSRRRPRSRSWRPTSSARSAARQWAQRPTIAVSNPTLRPSFRWHCWHLAVPWSAPSSRCTFPRRPSTPSSWWCWSGSGPTRSSDPDSAV